MFSYDPSHWYTFITAVIVLTIAPGPDIAFILGHTIRSGKKAGAAAMLGIWTGASIHVLLAALGLSALIAASAVGFVVVKLAGAAYLIWIGVHALRSGDGEFAQEVRDGGKALRAIFWQGALTNLLNPKVAVFFLAFLPQFVTPDAGPVWAQLMLHGMLVIAAAAVLEPLLVLSGDRITARLRGSRHVKVWLDRAFGAMLIALGLRLAFSGR